MKNIIQNPNLKLELTREITIKKYYILNNIILL